LDRPFGTWHPPFNLGDSLRNFLGAAPGALKNHLNTDELTRITLTALTTGGGTLGLLQLLLVSVGTIFPAPTDAALAALTLTVLLESLRRLGHGQEPVPAGSLKSQATRRNPGPTPRS
jgi:hypothetical protein